MIMLTRSSERIFNPMRYTSIYLYIYINIYTYNCTHSDWKADPIKDICNFAVKNMNNCSPNNGTALPTKQLCHTARNSTIKTTLLSKLVIAILVNLHIS